MPFYSMPFVSMCSLFPLLLFRVAAVFSASKGKATVHIGSSILDDIFFSQQVVCRRLKYLRGLAHPHNDSSCTVV